MSPTSHSHNRFEQNERVAPLGESDAFANSRPLTPALSLRRGRIFGRRERAFTVTELLVAVSLMTLIVLALYSMFNQVQKAMRSNETQVDSNERGRAVLELVSRELESARVGSRANVTNLWIQVVQGMRFKQDDTDAGKTPLPDEPQRTNLFDYSYFLTKSEKSWRGIGYAVMFPTNVGGKEVLAPAIGGMGTLYRYETALTNRDYAIPTTNLFGRFRANLPGQNATYQQWPPSTNYNQIAEGIVHFKVLPYDTQGRLMAFGTTNIDSTYRMVRTTVSGMVFPYPLSNMSPDTVKTNAFMPNVVLSQTYFGDTLETTAAFRSNALPAYLELELGILEPSSARTYYQMMKDERPDQADRYLRRRMANVQIFRKRIPFRTVAQ